MDKQREHKTDLPTASLKLDAETLALLESSRVKSFIAPLIVKAHSTKSRKISVLTWDSGATARMAAKVLTVALSQQIDRKCALVIPEGIRVSAESFESLAVITLPEVDIPEMDKKIEMFVAEMDRIYPFQIFVGPSIKDWSVSNSARFRMALGSDAQILLAPVEGFSRAVVRQIEQFTVKYKLNWLGMISLANAGQGRAGHA